MANINSLLETYRLTVEVDDQASEPVAQLNESLSEVAGNARSASEGVQQFSTTANQGAEGLTRIGSSASVFDRLSQRVDPASKAMAALRREQQLYNDLMVSGQRDLANGLTTWETYNRVIDQQRMRMDQARASVTAATQAYEAARGPIGQWRAAFNAADQDYEKFLGNVRATNQAGTQATTSLTHMAEGARNTRYQYMVLTDEVHKFLDQVIAGGNPLQAAFYQVPNAAQMVSQLGGIKQVFADAKSAIGGVVTALGGVGTVAAGVGFTAVIASMTALGVAAEKSQNRLLALQNTLRQTHDVDTANILGGTALSAAQNYTQNTPGVSIADARGAAATIAGAASFAGTTAQLQSLLGLSRNLAVVMGQDLPQASKLVAQALDDPARVAQELADKHFPGLDQSLVRVIRDFQESGQPMQATSTLLDAMGKSTAGATEHVSELTKAWERFHNALKLSLDSGFLGLMGKLALDTATAAVNIAGGNFGGHGVDLAAANQQRIAANNARYGNSAVNYSDRMVVLSPNDRDGTPGIGMFQLKQATIDGLNKTYGANLNAYDQQSNISAAVLLLRENLQRNHGSVDRALAQYNGGTGANGTVERRQAYINGVKAQDTSRLDPAIAQQIAQTAVAYGIGAQTELLKKIALQESGGHQYRDQVNGANASNNPGTSYAQSASSAQSIAQSQALAAQAGLKAAQGAGTFAQQQDDLKKKLDAAGQSLAYYRQQLDAASKAGDTSKVSQYKTAVGDLEGQINKLHDAQTNLLTPQQQLIKSAQDQLKAVQGLTEGDRVVAAAEQHWDEVQRQHSETLGTAADKAAYMAAVIGKQSVAFRQNVHDIDQNITNNQALAAAWEKGGAQAQNVAIQQKAMADALKLFPQGSEQARAAAETLTSKYKDLAKSQAEAQLSQQTDQNRNQLELLQAETATLGQDADARALYLTRLQTEQQLKTQGIDINDKFAQSYINTTLAITEQTQQLAHQQQVISDVSSAFSSSFENVGNSISDALVKGGQAGLKFSDILGGLSSQFSKFALNTSLLNPLLNAADGGKRTELSDIFSLGEKSVPVLGANGAVSRISSEDAAYASAMQSAANGGLYAYAAKVPAPNVTNTGLLGISRGDLQQGLGGFALGTGFGSMASGLLGGGKTGTIASLIGSGLGAGIGSIFGSPLLGGAIGGTVFGAIGSLFSHPKNPYTLATVTADNGGLAIHDVQNQKLDASSVVDPLQKGIDALNKTLKEQNIAITGSTEGSRVGIVGVDQGKHPLDGLQPNLEAILNRLNLSSGNAQIDQALNSLHGQTFDSVQDYLSQVQSITGFVNETVPNLLKQTAEGTSSFQSTLDTLNTSFAEAIKQAGNYGLATDALADKQKQLTADYYTQARKQLDSQTDNLQVRDLRAQGQSQQADLLNQSLSATSEQDAFRKSWKDIYGDAYEQQQGFGTAWALLLKTQGDERAAIEKQYEENRTDTLKQQIQLRDQLTALEVRDLKARGYSEQADLLNLQLTQSQERDSFNESWKSMYGDAYAQQESYGHSWTQLVKTQNDEVLALQKQYNDQRIALQGQTGPYEVRRLKATGQDQQADLLNQQVQAQAEMAQLNKSWADAYANWGPDGYKDQPGYRDALTQLQAAQAAERAQIIKHYEQQQTQVTEQQAQARLQLTQNVEDLRVRALKARGQDEQADLLAQQLSAQRELQSFNQSWKETWGDHYASMATYQEALKQMLQTQNDELLAVQKRYHDQTLQQANSWLDQLNSYAKGLAFSADSPLSAADQYKAANDNLNSDWLAAQSGDWTAAQNLQADLQQFLSASKTLYGSTQNYVSDYSHVVDILSQVSQFKPESLVSMIEKSSSQQQDLQKQSNELIRQLITYVGRLETELRQQTRSLNRNVA